MQFCYSFLFWLFSNPGDEIAAGKAHSHWNVTGKQQWLEELVLGGRSFVPLNTQGLVGG